jgi:hypothetical protein
VADKVEERVAREASEIQNQPREELVVPNLSMTLQLNTPLTRALPIR